MNFYSVIQIILVGILLFLSINYLSTTFLKKEKFTEKVEENEEITGIVEKLTEVTDKLTDVVNTLSNEEYTNNEDEDDDNDDDVEELPKEEFKKKKSKKPKKKIAKFTQKEEEEDNVNTEKFTSYVNGMSSQFGGDYLLLDN
tara:strand:+ start:598 stop:1023 length:426 start_codon:yes stop_codon:yes gene_type:complete